MCFPPSLTNIPPEILDEIAFHTVLHQASSNLHPPRDLYSLLLTCKAIHESLSTSYALLARIFRLQFDYAALARRFSSSWLTSNVLADQLKTRWTILKRIRAVGASWERQGDKKDSWPIDSWGRTNVTEDLWMAFLMLLESDGKNVQQLRNAKMQSYLDAYVNVFLIRRAKQYDYQNETVNSSLAIWIAYLLEDEATIAKESISQVETFTGLIRPFVFGAHRYDSYFAPWSIFDLPVTAPPEQQNSSGVSNNNSSNHRLPPRYRDRQFAPYMASDLDLQDNSQPVTCLSRQLLMCAPILTLAAINSYFTRVDYHFRMRPAMAAAAAAGHHPTNTGAGPAPAVMPSAPAVVAPRIGTDVNYYATTDDSTVYDGDFRRLTSCLNPYIKSLPPGESFYPPGTFAGVWEGRFTFLEFDQYRDMLVGFKLPPIVKVDELLGGQQPQVWKVNEYHLIRSAAEEYRKRAESETNGMRSSPEASSSSSSRMSPVMRAGRSPVDATPIEPLPIGHALNAHLPVGCRFVEVPGGLEVHEAGKPGCLFYKYSSRLSDMSSPSMSSGDLNGRSSDGNTHNSNSNHTLHSEGNEDDEQILDTLITGSGHSAWGPFTLRGRVRQWDGLVTVLKDYSGSDGIDPADSSAHDRGRWLYRGYVLSGGNLVGRWRDTVTQLEYCGYEGAFALHIRR